MKISLLYPWGVGLLKSVEGFIRSKCKVDLPQQEDMLSADNPQLLSTAATDLGPFHIHKPESQFSSLYSASLFKYGVIAVVCLWRSLVQTEGTLPCLRICACHCGLAQGTPAQEMKFRWN